MKGRYKAETLETPHTTHAIIYDEVYVRNNFLKVLNYINKRLKVILKEISFEGLKWQQTRWLDVLITGDESLCFQYDPKTKCSTREKNADFAIADLNSIVHFEFNKQGRTVN